MTVPLHNPEIGASEIERVSTILEEQALGNDKYHARCEDLLEEMTGAERVLLTTSCTSALEMAAILLDIEEGDEVVVPSWTFPATANAFVRRGATPVFVDIDRETLTVDIDELRASVTPETAAIVPVTYAGISPNMHALMDVATEYDVPVIEDAAQGICASYDEQPIGTFGDIGCVSFDWAKNYVAGEGGAVLLNDERYVDRAEVLYRSGTNYEAFRRGEVESYSWTDIGSRYRPSELQAGLIYTQLQHRTEITDARETVHQRYTCELTPALPDGVSATTIPDACSSNYHIYYLLCSSLTERTELSAHLDESGIDTAPHYQPLHSSEMGASFGYTSQDLQTTEDIADRLLRVPIHPSLSHEQIDHVIQQIRMFYR